MLKIISHSDLYVPAAERTSFDSRRTELLRDLQPVNSPQAEQTNSALRAAWTIRRCDLSERQLGEQLGCDPLLSDDKRLARIQRTRTQAQREYRMAMNELKRLQTDHAIRRLQENAGLQALPVPVDTDKYIQAARAAAGKGPKERICFPPVQEELDKLLREQGLGHNVWEVWFKENELSQPVATPPASARSTAGSAPPAAP